MIAWIESLPLWWLGAISAVSFVLSLLAVPVIAVRIPEDYFSRERRQKNIWSTHNVFIWSAFVVAKNVLGSVLLFAGVLMLLLPGQGVLTIFAGVLLMNFPGKYRLERYCISRAPVLRGINWIRTQWGVKPLVVGP